MDTRRHTPRYDCSTRLTGAGAASARLRGEVRDVSATGLCLNTNVALKPGQTLHLAFELPTGAVDLVGEVRWVKRGMQGCDIGVRFVRVPATASVAIQAAATTSTFPVAPPATTARYVFR